MVARATPNRTTPGHSLARGHRRFESLSPNPPLYLVVKNCAFQVVRVERVPLAPTTLLPSERRAHVNCSLINCAVSRNSTESMAWPERSFLLKRQFATS